MFDLSGDKPRAKVEEDKATWYQSVPVDKPLTKRERLAMANWTEDELIQMARVITNEINSGDIKFEDYVNAEDPKVLAKARVRLADTLLEELDKEKA